MIRLIKWLLAKIKALFYKVEIEAEQKVEIAEKAIEPKIEEKL